MFLYFSSDVKLSLFGNDKSFRDSSKNIFRDSSKNTFRDSSKNTFRYSSKTP